LNTFRDTCRTLADDSGHLWAVNERMCESNLGEDLQLGHEDGRLPISHKQLKAVAAKRGSHLAMRSHSRTHHQTISRSGVRLKSSIFDTVHEPCNAMPEYHRDSAQTDAPIKDAGCGPTSWRLAAWAPIPQSMQVWNEKKGASCMSRCHSTTSNNLERLHLLLEVKCWRALNRAYYAPGA
jgi:hypothetical protein